MDMPFREVTEVIRGRRLFPGAACVLSSKNARARGLPEDPEKMRFPKIAATLAAAAVFATVAAPPTAAQQPPIPYGGWTGTMTPPGGQPITVTYEVGELDGVLAIVMRALMVQEIIPFNDIRVEADALVFWWNPGVRVDCRLERTSDGSYAGPCTAGGTGAAGALTMVPPVGQ
jgi:hypothetical protein